MQQYRRGVFRSRRLLQNVDSVRVVAERVDSKYLAVLEIVSLESEEERLSSSTGDVTIGRGNRSRLSSFLFQYSKLLSRQLLLRYVIFSLLETGCCPPRLFSRSTSKMSGSDICPVKFDHRKGIDILTHVLRRAIASPE